MKVIDLLNKIANGEEVPKVIKFQNYYCYYRPLKNQYTDFKNDPILEWNYIVMNSLNDEVEIIEEEKEIKKIDFMTLNTQKEKNRAMKDTINELIDIVKELKNEKENK